MEITLFSLDSYWSALYNDVNIVCVALNLFDKKAMSSTQKRHFIFIHSHLLLLMNATCTGSWVYDVFNRMRHFPVTVRHFTRLWRFPGMRHFPALHKPYFQSLFISIILLLVPSVDELWSRVSRAPTILISDKKRYNTNNDKMIKIKCEFCKMIE